MKNCERSEQEKIKIFKLFSGNFGNKMFKKKKKTLRRRKKKPCSTGEEIPKSGRSVGTIFFSENELPEYLGYANCIEYI